MLACWDPAWAKDSIYNPFILAIARCQDCFKRTKLDLGNTLVQRITDQYLFHNHRILILLFHFHFIPLHNYLISLPYNFGRPIFYIFPLDIFIWLIFKGNLLECMYMKNTSGTMKITARKEPRHTQQVQVGKEREGETERVADICMCC